MKQRMEISFETPPESMRERIDRITQDLKELQQFYAIQISATRHSKLQNYCSDQLTELKGLEFHFLGQGDKIDYLLLKKLLERRLEQLRLDAVKDDKTRLLLSFVPIIVRLCEERQSVKDADGKNAAKDVSGLVRQIGEMAAKVQDGEIKIDRPSAFRAARTVDELRNHLEEWYGFYQGYDPMFTWWVKAPLEKAMEELASLGSVIRENLVGIKPGDEDTIVGDPIGRDGLLADLDAEMIPYTPEELIEIGETEYVWCEKEMLKASQELGYGNDWKAALECVKELYVEPGKQPQLVHDLAWETIDYIRKYDMVTVPNFAADLWRTFMMTPEAQKINPFFLGGDNIIVSYPTDIMDHEMKMMSMRGNNVHFSRSTVFHELIPGHHLQFYMKARHKQYRGVFTTPFWIEGWSLYWEMILWDRKFPETPENKIGMLFWRMHRCARIIFSIKFHLGQMSPQECIDFLVEKVGHERFTAEGEVRRSFNGDYSPLYQAGYMLGALQLYALRQEVVGPGKMTEKQYHDRVLRENEMPIEMLRALIKNQLVWPDFKTSWKFYGKGV